MIRLIFVFAIWIAPWPAVAQVPMSNQVGSGPQERGLTDPNPDPTIATIDRLNDAIKNVQALMKNSDDALRDLFAERFASIERATQLRLQAVEAIPSEIKDSIKHLDDLMTARFQEQDVKFSSIQRQFDDQAKTIDKIAGLSKEAIDSAFASSEKAIGKSDENTSTLIAQQGETLRTQKEATDLAIGDLKNSMTRMESRLSGQDEAKDTLSGNVGLAVGVGGVIIAGVGLLLAMNRRPASEPQVRYIQMPVQQQQPPGITTTTNTSAA